MKMIFFLLAVFFAQASHAVFFYNWNFEEPEFTNGQLLGKSQNVLVSDSASALDGQYLLIRNGAGYTFAAPETIGGQHYISWDVAVPEIEVHGSPFLHTYIGLPEEGQFRSSITDSGRDAVNGPILTYGDGTEYGTFLNVPFEFDTTYRYEIYIDLDNGIFSFVLDGIMLRKDTFAMSASGGFSVSFTQGQYVGLQAGIDNFRWEYTASTIPEPATVGLLLLGGGVLALRRKRITR